MYICKGAKIRVLTDENNGVSIYSLDPLFIRILHAILTLSFITES